MPRDHIHQESNERQSFFFGGGGGEGFGPSFPSPPLFEGLEPAPGSRIGAGPLSPFSIFSHPSELRDGLPLSGVSESGMIGFLLGGVSGSSEVARPMASALQWLRRP